MSEAKKQKVVAKEVELPEGYNLEEWTAVGNSVYILCIDTTGKKHLLVVPRYT